MKMWIVEDLSGAPITLAMFREYSDAREFADKHEPGTAVYCDDVFVKNDIDRLQSGRCELDMSGSIVRKKFLPPGY